MEVDQAQKIIHEFNIEELSKPTSTPKPYQSRRIKFTELAQPDFSLEAELKQMQEQATASASADQAITAKFASYIQAKQRLRQLKVVSDQKYDADMKLQLKEQRTSKSKTLGKAPSSKSSK